MTNFDARAVILSAKREGPLYAEVIQLLLGAQGSFGARRLRMTSLMPDAEL
jgi:hypothetical protein